MGRGWQLGESPALTSRKTHNVGVDRETKDNDAHKYYNSRDLLAGRREESGTKGEALAFCLVGASSSDVLGLGQRGARVEVERVGIKAGGYLQRLNVWRLLHEGTEPADRLQGSSSSINGVQRREGSGGPEIDARVKAIDA